MKILINTCFGGFGISDQALSLWSERTGKKKLYGYEADLRTDSEMIKIFEERGSEFVNGPYASLKLIEIPDGIEFEISDYDGMESVEEKHRSWS